MAIERLNNFIKKRYPETTKLWQYHPDYEGKVWKRIYILHMAAFASFFWPFGTNVEESIIASLAGLAVSFEAQEVILKVVTDHEKLKNNEDNKLASKEFTS